MDPPSWVTIATDFGPHYAAQVRAVLAGSLPPGSVVELTHDLPPHDIPQGAFLLRAMAERFPPRSVHLAVVDPGVGGRRAPIVIRCRGDRYLVGPDNGLLAPLAARWGPVGCWRLDPERVHPGAGGSRTFDGRDLFAPAAALLANGTPAPRLGERWRFRRLRLPEVGWRGRSARGMVRYVDRFGNVITNIRPPPAIPDRLVVEIGDVSAPARGVPTYSDLRPGELGVLTSSFGTLEVSESESAAGARLRARAGLPVRLSAGGASRRALRPRRPRRVLSAGPSK